DHALDVRDPDIFYRQPQVDEQVEAGQRGSPRARHDQLDLLDVFLDDLQRADEGRGHTDGRAVLVVVEDGDLHALAQLALDHEAFGRLDVFEVDAAEGRLEPGNDVDQLVGVVFVDL